jgi:hypothetical protein
MIHRLATGTNCWWRSRWHGRLALAGSERERDRRRWRRQMMEKPCVPSHLAGPDAGRVFLVPSARSRTARIKVSSRRAGLHACDPRSCSVRCGSCLISAGPLIRSGPRQGSHRRGITAHATPLFLGATATAARLCAVIWERWWAMGLRGGTARIGPRTAQIARGVMARVGGAGR